MTKNLLEKIMELQDNLDIAILKIRIKEEQLKKFKMQLKKLHIKDEDYKGAQPIDMLVKKKKNLYHYGGIEIETKSEDIFIKK